MEANKRAKLGQLFRVLGIVIVIILFFAGLIWLGSQQDKGSVAPTTDAVTATDHVTGNPDGPVTLIEYADYQCPACGAYYPVTKQLLATYGDHLRLVYRNFPLITVHKNALTAAYAAEAADLQGKFWEYHDHLFETQNTWSTLDDPTETFIGYATDLGLNADQFRSDMQSKSVKDRVAADMRSGNNAKVTGTPTFYLDGQLLKENPRGFQPFSDVIQARLTLDGVTEAPTTATPDSTIPTSN